MGDAEKRQNYDLKSSLEGNPSPFEYKSSPFPGFEEVLDTGEEVFGSTASPRAYRGEDIHANLTVSFLDAAKGARVSVLFDRTDLCTTCEGSKVRSGSPASRCPNCGGRGVVFLRRGSMSVQVKCAKCQGAGTIARLPCVTCNGTGFATILTEEVIAVPAGVDTGQTLRAAGRGHRSEGEGPPGDLLVKIRVSSHPIYKRSKYDVYMTASVPISKAVLGGVVTVDTIQGKTRVEIPAGSDFQQAICLSGKGIQHLAPDSKRKGDCYVSFTVQIPTQLTPKQLTLFQQLSLEDSNPPVQSEGFFAPFLHRKH